MTGALPAVTEFSGPVGTELFVLGWRPPGAGSRASWPYTMNSRWRVSQAQGPGAKPDASPLLWEKDKLQL